MLSLRRRGEIPPPWRPRGETPPMTTRRERSATKRPSPRRLLAHLKQASPRRDPRVPALERRRLSASNMASKLPKGAAARAALTARGPCQRGTLYRAQLLPLVTQWIRHCPKRHFDVRLVYNLCDLNSCFVWCDDSKRRYNVVRNRACRASTRVAVEGHAHGMACVKVMGGEKTRRLRASSPLRKYNPRP